MWVIEYEIANLVVCSAFYVLRCEPKTKKEEDAGYRG